MFSLPKSTEFNKRIPKQKFYENLTVTPALKKAITEQIKIIYWRNKIADTTMNIAKGSVVTEIEVFEIKLSTPTLDEAVLRQIDKEIPYHILFLLEYEGRYQAWIGYKEAALSGGNAFKVSGYYHTEWLAEDELPLKIDGLDVDTVYEGFVRQIADFGAEDGVLSAELPLNQAIQKNAQAEQLKKQIEALEKKIRKEKQFNRQVEMNAELKKLRKELTELI